MLQRLGVLFVSAAILVPAQAIWVGTASASATFPCPPVTMETMPGSGICQITFLASTSWAIPGGVSSVDVLLVGGGGAGGARHADSDLSGGAAGGGGGGGVTQRVGVAVFGLETASITVGAGGTGHDRWNGGNGGASWFSTVTSGLALSAGGGLGGDNGQNIPQGTGGSGGYGGMSGNGNLGGRGDFTPDGFGGQFTSAGGGGGGAGGTGANALTYKGGDGGGGTTPSLGLFAGWTGTFGGGGGGGCAITGCADNVDGWHAGTGTAGGGDGGGPISDGKDGDANSGGGGGGNLGHGGAGFVTVRFINPLAFPTVETGTAADVTASTATLDGTVVQDGMSSIEERGIVFAPTATDATPTIGETGVTRIIDTNSGLGGFSEYPTDLLASTEYTFAAYATNSFGTRYGEFASFTTTAKASQAISWSTTAPTTARAGGSGYRPGATSDTGLTVAITVDATASTICSLVSGTVHYLAAGTCVLDANQPGDAETLAATQKQQTFTIGAAATALTATITVGPKTYDGTTGATIATCTLVPDPGSTVTCDASSATAAFTSAAAGPHPVLVAGLKLAGSGASSGDYTFGGTATGSGTIDPATSTTVVTCSAGPFTYTGSAQAPCTVKVTGAGGLSLTPDPTYEDNTSAGSATASYTFPGDANHSGSSSSVHFAIGQANPSCSITGYSVTYDGSAHTATGSCTGIGGAVLPGLDLSATTHTNVISTTGGWTFSDADGDYADASGSVATIIGKASSTTVVTCPAGPYTFTGSALTPCAVRVTGAGGLSFAPDAVYVDNLHAGGAMASYVYGGDANHVGSRDAVGFRIGQAASVTDVTCPAGPSTFTGSAQTPCAVSVTGAGGLSLAPSPDYVDNVHAGTATASSTFAGDVDHLGSSDSETFVIDKADSITEVTCPAGPYTYTGAAQTPCSAAVTGAGGLSLRPTPTYLDNTAFGTASAAVTYPGDTDHFGSSDSTTFQIGKAASVTTVTCPTDPVPYTGTARTPCTVSVTGAGGLSLAPTPTYLGNTAVGPASASYVYDGDANHSGSRDGAGFEISKAASATVVTCPAGPYTYTGSAQTPCTVRVTGAGGLDLAPAVTYVDNTAAGVATASYTYDGDDSHTGSNDSDTFTIGKAASVTDVTCPAGPYAYTGSAQTPCSVSVTGAGGLSLAATPTYAGNTHAGPATASYDYAGDGNHLGSGDLDTFTIGKAMPSCIVSAYDVTFDAAAHAATGSCTGVGGSADVLAGLSLTATTHTDPGDWPSDTWRFTDVTGDYLDASGTVHDRIVQAVAVLTYGGPTYLWLGTASSVTLTLPATLSPTICGPVRYSVTPFGGSALPGSGPSWTLVPGLYDILVSTPGTAGCAASSDEAVLAVVGPADTASGGGWTKVTTLATGSPRTNFGFTIQKTTKAIRGSTNVTVTYAGSLLWVNNGQWRFKAKVASTSVLTSTGGYVSGAWPLPYGLTACPASFLATLPAGSTGVSCGSLSGTGTLEQWSSTANGGLGAWLPSTYGTVSFTATVFDGGQAKVCKTTGKGSCSTVTNADAFGIQFDPVPAAVIRESAPVLLGGGSIKAS